MAQKRITELQLRANVTDDLNFPSDDGIQSYRVTALQVKTYILSLGVIARSMLATGAVAKLFSATKTANYTVLPTDDVLICDAAAGNITMTLPAVASSAGMHLTFKKIGTDVNKVIIDGNGTELIDGVQVKNMVMPFEERRLFCDGTAWFVISASFGKLINQGVSDSLANVTTTAYMKRINETQVSFNTDSPVTGALGTQLDVTIPTFLTPDTSVYATPTGYRYQVGESGMYNAGSSYPGRVLLTGATTLRFTSNNTGADANINASTPFVWGTGDKISSKCVWHVSGWD